MNRTILPRLLGILFFLPFLTSAHANPDFRDENWTNIGGPTSPNDIVRAAVIASDGTLYIGGDFTAIGDVEVGYIARWDGISWSSLGTGMNGKVNALTILGNHLYVTGAFTAAGGMNANYIALWDGDSWSPLGSGMSSWGHALTVMDGELYAGGQFRTAGGVTVNQIARWDGNTWSPLGSGVDGRSARVQALTGFAGNLYAGGVFTAAGGVSANNIARWDGSSWSPLGSGVDSWVNAVAVSGDTVYAGGVFRAAGGVSAARVARWDGTSWSPLGSGLNGDVYALEISGNNLFAGGTFLSAGNVSANRIARWNASSWSPLGSGTNGAVFALSLHENDLYTGGAFTVAGGTASTYLAKACNAVPRDGFDAWAEALPADQRGKTDDPGGHGIPNLLRYAFGMAPILPDREALPRPALSAPSGEEPLRFNLTLIYTRRTDDPDLVFTPESSEDLFTWTPLVDAEEIAGSNGATETVIVTDPAPVDAQPKGSLRVRVERKE